MGAPAQNILLPPQTNMMRVVFLYVGQGESTLLFIPNNGTHLKMLIDSNQGRNTGGIDLIKMLKDLCEGEEARLDYFVNTHPHSDHAGDLDAIQDEIEITNVWHSGHDPGPNHSEAYNALKKLRKKVSDNGGEDRALCGSRETQTLGEAVYNVLSPAQYVQDDISDETPEIRYRRIHEHCAVLRIGYGSPEPKFVLITGDSDKCAWKEHITEYHGAGDENRLKAEVLSASHHGSRTFFKTDENDPEPYTRHMDFISPQYLVISSPVQEESCHGHPHDDALELYKKYVAEENILHTGEGKTSYILDIYSDGQIFIDDDNGDLASTYGFTSDEANKNNSGNSNNGGNNSRTSPNKSPYVITRVDERPMG
ncbi:MAG: MBL fold metallo-hydrolase [Acidobacteriota bacterium]|nr:MBL fold metallo-hydrolase [Acidobacteriota bacterium]